MRGEVVVEDFPGKRPLEQRAGGGEEANWGKPGGRTQGLSQEGPLFGGTAEGPVRLEL